VNDDAYPGLDVDDPWQAVEACFAQGWTDGLPGVVHVEAGIRVVVHVGLGE
jgi:hypothetical protein